jgi:hypothetical protein
MKKGNPYSHFYLYAKYWYKKTDDTIDDLKTILSNYSGTDKKYLSLSDLNNVMLEIAEYEVLVEKSKSFKDFVFDCSKDGLINACISLMVNTSTGTGDRESLLFPPDKNILPLEDGSEEIMKTMNWAV